MTFQKSMQIAKTLSMLACCVALFTLQAEAAPSGVTATDGVIGYLGRFGYPPPPSPHFAERRMMKTPRCGLPDNAEPCAGGQSERYTCLGDPWGKGVITYRVSKYTNKLKKTDVDEVIKRAFTLWAEHSCCSLRFKRLPDGPAANINIKFLRKSEGYKGDVMGYTTIPDSSNTVVITVNGDENWTIGALAPVYRGGGANDKDFSWVALHEIGHALGLGHSEVKTAIMTEFWEQNAAVELHQADIDGIKALYCEKSGRNNNPDCPTIDNEIDTGDPCRQQFPPEECRWSGGYRWPPFNYFQGYLERFGYLPPPSRHFAELRTEESLSEAISDFQSYMGIDVTGVADYDTIRVMKASRCGLPDKTAPSTGGRSKRYAFTGEQWWKRVITYRVSKYTKKLSQKVVDRVIAEAFALWAEHVPLTFKRSSSRWVDIDIRFVRKSHGDDYPFDGPGNTLAHAFSPGFRIGGDIHFDEDEHWTIGKRHRSYRWKDTDLSWVALHEIGHALGLDHSNVKTAIMWPTYQPHGDVKLDQDDIDGIEDLYSD